MIVPILFVKVIEIVISKLNKNLLAINCKTFEENNELMNFLNKVNNSEDLSYNDETILFLIKYQINIGNWDYLEYVENEHILVELLFDWLLDSVNNIISPDKLHNILYSIIELFNSKNSDINIENNSKYVKNNFSQNKDINRCIARECFITIKNMLNKTELESILEIAYFISMLKLSAIKFEFNNKNHLENLNIFILNINKVIAKLLELIIGIKDNNVCYYSQLFNNYENFMINSNIIICLSNKKDKQMTRNEINDFIDVEFKSFINLLNQIKSKINTKCFVIDGFDKSKNSYEYVLILLFSFLSIVSNDMILRFSELRIYKRNNICLSTLYSGNNYNNIFYNNKRELATLNLTNKFSKNSNIDLENGNEIVTNNDIENNNILIQMHDELNQYVSYGANDKTFFKYFIFKYYNTFKDNYTKTSNLFLNKEDKLNCKLKLKINTDRRQSLSYCNINTNSINKRTISTTKNNVTDNKLVFDSLNLDYNSFKEIVYKDKFSNKNLSNFKTNYNKNNTKMSLLNKNNDIELDSNNNSHALENFNNPSINKDIYNIKIKLENYDAIKNNQLNKDINFNDTVYLKKNQLTSRDNINNHINLKSSIKSQNANFIIEDIRKKSRKNKINFVSDLNNIEIIDNSIKDIINPNKIKSGNIKSINNPDVLKKLVKSYTSVKLKNLV